MFCSSSSVPSIASCLLMVKGCKGDTCFKQAWENKFLKQMKLTVAKFLKKSLSPKKLQFHLKW